VFRQTVAEKLPAYARPVFLRLLTTLDATGTFKPKKQSLVQEGFDPGRVKDPLYVDDQSLGRYVSIDQDMHRALRASGIRL
jgi:fatty-acyl-CoA synthase